MPKAKSLVVGFLALLFLWAVAGSLFSFATGGDASSPSSPPAPADAGAPPAPPPVSPVVAAREPPTAPREEAAAPVNSPAAHHEEAKPSPPSPPEVDVNSPITSELVDRLIANAMRGINPPATPEPVVDAPPPPPPADEQPAAEHREPAPVENHEPAADKPAAEEPRDTPAERHDAPPAGEAHENPPAGEHQAEPAAAVEHGDKPAGDEQAENKPAAEEPVQPPPAHEGEQSAGEKPASDEQAADSNKPADGQQEPAADKPEGENHADGTPIADDQGESKPAEQHEPAGGDEHADSPPAPPPAEEQVDKPAADDQQHPPAGDDAPAAETPPAGDGDHAQSEHHHDEAAGHDEHHHAEHPAPAGDGADKPAADDHHESPPADHGAEHTDHHPPADDQHPPADDAEQQQQHGSPPPDDGHTSPAQHARRDSAGGFDIEARLRAMEERLRAAEERALEAERRVSAVQGRARSSELTPVAADGGVGGPNTHGNAAYNDDGHPDTPAEDHPDHADKPAAEDAPAEDHADKPAAEDAPAEDHADKPAAEDAPAAEDHADHADKPAAEDAPAEDHADHADKPAAEDAPAAEDHADKPAAEDAPAEDHADKPAAEDAPAEDHADKPAAEDAPAEDHADHADKPAAEDHADHADKPAAEDAPAEDHADKPAAEDAPAEDHADKPAAEDAPVEDHADKPAAPVENREPVADPPDNNKPPAEAPAEVHDAPPAGEAHENQPAGEHQGEPAAPVEHGDKPAGDEQAENKPAAEEPVQPPPAHEGEQSAGEKPASDEQAADSNKPADEQHEPAGAQPHPAEPAVPKPAPPKKDPMPPPDEVPADARRCAGRVHRTWIRVGEAFDVGSAGEVAHVATAGTEHLLAAFTHNYFRDVDETRTEHDLSSPYFTAVDTADVLVTDECGRNVNADGSGRFDVVITYVDGDVPSIVELGKAHFEREYPDSKFDVSRLRVNGEMRYALRSAIRHAAHMIRRIVILVYEESHADSALDERTRAMAAEAGVKLVVVRHDQAFPDASVLPVFNSVAIESVLHRVPELTPFVLYGNDDILLGRRLSWFDIVRPALIELPRGLDEAQRQSGADGAAKLVSLPRGGGSHAVSVMTRRVSREDGQQRAAVFIEAETIPYGEYTYPEIFLTPDAAGTAMMDKRSIDPEVSQKCGPLKLNQSAVELAQVANKSRPYSHAMLMRHNREYVWNYLGVFQVHHDAHIARYMDRGLLALLFDGAEDGTRGPLLPAELVQKTRASRFRKGDNAGSSQLANFGAVAENRRRHAQLLANNGFSDALKHDLPCTDCPFFPSLQQCPSQMSRAGADFPLDYPEGRLHATTKSKLFSPVAALQHSPEYFFHGVRSLEQIERLIVESMRQRRLWVGLNDGFDEYGLHLPPELKDAMERLLRAAIGYTEEN